MIPAPKRNKPAKKKIIRKCSWKLFHQQEKTKQGEGRKEGRQKRTHYSKKKGKKKVDMEGGEGVGWECTCVFRLRKPLQQPCNLLKKSIGSAVEMVCIHHLHFWLADSCVSLSHNSTLLKHESHAGQIGLDSVLFTSHGVLVPLSQLSCSIIPLSAQIFLLILFIHFILLFSSCSCLFLTSCPLSLTCLVCFLSQTSFASFLLPFLAVIIHPPLPLSHSPDS